MSWRRYSAIVCFLCDSAARSPRCTWRQMVVVVSNELARMHKEATLGYLVLSRNLPERTNRTTKNLMISGLRAELWCQEPRRTTRECCPLDRDGVLTMDCRDVKRAITKGIKLPQDIVTVYTLIEISLSLQGREFVGQLGQQIPLLIGFRRRTLLSGVLDRAQDNPRKQCECMPK
jgi:hypothetical protein